MKRISNKLWESKYKPLLKKQFNEMGILSCELRFPECKGQLFWSFAHSFKRADIYTEEQMMEVILTCNSCHSIIEGRQLDKRINRFWTKQEMEDKVKSVISERLIWET